MDQILKFIVKDEWLSSILQRDAYKLAVNEGVIEKISDTASDEADRLRELQSGSVFMFAKIPVASVSACKVLEALGFNLVDTNILFERSIEAPRELTGNSQIRFSLPEDREAVMEVARENFIFSRFHLDPMVPDDAANEIKARWAGNFYAGNRGDYMVVGVVDGVIAGFLQLLKTADGRLIIDLIAADQRYRGRGIGSDMISFAEAQIAGCKKYVVGTQIANVPSMRLYEKLGFRVSNAQYVFHYNNI